MALRGTYCLLFLLFLRLLASATLQQQPLPKVFISEQKMGDDNQLRLRVTLRDMQLQPAPSCQVAFPQVELHNVHPTESVVVYSVSTSMEETSWEDSTGQRQFWGDYRVQLSSEDSDANVMLDAENEDLRSPTHAQYYRRQLQPSRLPEGSLELKPDQVAILPVSFLPRFPTDHQASSVAGTSAQAEFAQPSSAPSYERADWEDWRSDSRSPPGGKTAKSNWELLEQIDQKPRQYLVRTLLTIQTSRGTIRMPFSVVSVMRNHYGLPSLITLNSGFTSSVEGKDSTNVNMTASGCLDTNSSAHSITSDDVELEVIQIISRRHPSEVMDANSSHSSNNWFPTDCYDVFMRNPSLDEALTIKEALVTLPEGVALIIAGADRIPKQVIRRWDSAQGYLTIDAGEPEPQYVVTVCPSSKGIFQEAKAELEVDKHLIPWYEGDREPNSLGLLQIKTSVGTFAIALEKSANECSPTSIKAKGSQHGNLEDFFESFLPDDSGSVEEDRGQSSPAPLSMHAEKEVLRAVPESIDHLFLRAKSDRSSPVKTTKRWTIGLENSGPRDIKVIRASVGIPSGQLVNSGSVKIGLISVHEDLSLPIRPGGSASEAILLQGTVYWDKLLNHSGRENTSVTLEGAVIVRVTLLTVREKRNLGGNPSTADSNDSIALEIPFKLKVVAGNIGVVVEKATDDSVWTMRPRAWKAGSMISSGLFPRSLASASQQNGDFPIPHELTSLQNELHVVSDIGTDLKLRSVSVVSSSNSTEEISSTKSVCSQFTAIANIEGPIHMGWGLQSIGKINVLYQFADEYSKEMAAPVAVCYLKYSTSPDTGFHMIPLVSYPGRLDISFSPFESSSNTSFFEWDDQPNLDHFHHATVGFDNVLDWFRSTNMGSTLRAVIRPFGYSDRGANKDEDRDWLRTYLFQLASGSTKESPAKLNPVLLRVGAIAHGAIETLPLYLTNYNPVPISISVDVGELEGMSISLSHDVSSANGGCDSVQDYMPSLKFQERSVRKVSTGRFTGHPTAGLRQFLLRGDITDNFLGRFPYRDSISRSKRAVKVIPFLKNLYSNSSMVTFRRTSFADRRSSEKCGRAGNPAPYGPFQRKPSRRHQPGPLLVSRLVQKYRELSVCDRLKHADMSVNIPPGAVARFDITLRSPSGAALDKDITEFLSTGLVLSTNHGEKIPILLSFESLKGKLDLSYAPSSSTSDFRDNVVRVPATLFAGSTLGGESSQRAVHIAPWNGVMGSSSDIHIVTRNATGDKNNVPLYARSSFARNIRLRKMLSCNPLFTVSALEDDYDMHPDPSLGVRIGYLRSNFTCETQEGLAAYNSTSFPSFFRCALSWLSRRAELQPPGCGSPPAKVKARPNGNTDHVDSDVSGIERAMHSLNRVVEACEEPNPRNGTDAKRYPSSFGDGVADLDLLQASAEAWNAWRTISDTGLRKIGTSLRAIVDYNATTDEKEPGRDDVISGGARMLSVAIPDTVVESILEMPSLLDTDLIRDRFQSFVAGDENDPSILRLPSAVVGNVVSVDIPIRNPTAVAVRVRLAVTPHQKNHMLTSNETPGRGFLSQFLGNYRSPFVQSSSLGSFGLLNDADRHWWGEEGAYFHADTHGDLVRSHQNATIKAGTGAQFSLIHPSLMFNTAFLVGCGARCGVQDEVNGNRRNSLPPGVIDLTPTSPIGAAAAAGSILIGRSIPETHHRAVLGEIAGGSSHGSDMFGAGGSLMSSSRGPSAFALPLAALNEVVIPPYGTTELGPVLFRPPGRADQHGCGSVREGRLSDNCLRQSFQTLLLLENSLTGIERLVLEGNSQWEKVVFVDPVSSENKDVYGNIELRNGKSTLVFPGTADPMTRTMPIQKEVLVHNAGDTSVKLNGVYFGDDSQGGNILSKCRLGEFVLPLCNESRLAPIRLHPGENHSIYVQHEPRCAKQKDYVNILVELAGESDRSGIFGILHSYHIELPVGYEMSQKELSECLPSSGGRGPALSEFVSHSSFLNPLFRIAPGWLVRAVTHLLHFLWILLRLILVVLWSGIMAQRLASRQKMSKRFMAYLNAAEKEGTGLSKPFLSLETGETWYAAFRCLARVDPTAADLQTLGREQTRQIVLMRYRMIEYAPPYYFTGSGMMHRERAGGSGGKATVRSNSKPTPSGGNERGNERLRTLSDGLLGGFVNTDTLAFGRFPCQLGWSVALTRGIIHSDTLATSPIRFLSTDLTDVRSSHSLSFDEIEGPPSSSDSESDSETFQSSSGDLMESPEPLGQVELEDKGHRLIEGQAIGVDSVDIGAPATGEVVIKGGIASSLKSGEGTSERSNLTLAPASTNVAASENGGDTLNDSRGLKNVGIDPAKLKKKGVLPKKSKIQKQKSPSVETPEPPHTAAPIQPADQKQALDPRKSHSRVHNKSGGKEVGKITRQKKKQQDRKSAASGKNTKLKQKPASDSLIAEASQGLRPPPGLAPPPGFGDIALMQRRSEFRSSPTQAPSTVPKPALSGIGVVRPASSTLDSLESTGLVLEESVTSMMPENDSAQSPPPSLPVLSSLPESSSPSPFQSDPVKSPQVSDLPGSTDGFDVLAFLDDILNEGSASADDGGVLMESKDGTASQDSQAFSPNPWATTSDTHHSRAAAYGISIEEESNREPDPIDLPLLTPEVILSASVAREGDDERNKSVDLFASL